MTTALAHDLHVIADPTRAASALHPMRLKILGELDEPDSAAGLARRMGVPRQQLNYHLRQLEREGLVEPVGERKKRNCTERLMRAVARTYVISPSALGSVAANPAEVQDQASSTYLVAVAAQTIREVSEQRAKADRAGKRLATLSLQADVRFASQSTQHAFAEELAQTLARLVAKYHDDEAPDGRQFRVTAGAYPAPADADPAGRSQEEA